jgi:hypothetical protein
MVIPIDSLLLGLFLMKIYELFINLSPENENKVFQDKSGVFVNLYVSAIDLEHSIDKMKEYIKQDHFSLKDIEHVRVIDIEEWHEERDKESPTPEELTQLLCKNVCIYGCFHSYEFEYEH